MRFTVTLLLLGSLGSVQAEHLPELAWMQAFRGKHQESCCNRLDCQEATVALLSEDVRESTVQIGDTTITLPTAWVHPSQDPHGHGWVCFVHDTTPGNVYLDAEGRMRALPPAVFTRENVRCAFYISIQ